MRDSPDLGLWGRWREPAVKSVSAHPRASTGIPLWTRPEADADRSGLRSCPAPPIRWDWRALPPSRLLLPSASAGKISSWRVIRPVPSWT